MTVKRLLKIVLFCLTTFLLTFIFLETYLRLFDRQIFEVHPPGMYVADEDAGYVLSPGFRGSVQRPEFDAEFSINSRGFRGREFGAKADDVFRILVLGDSQAFGFGVSDEETFSFQLEKCLNERQEQAFEILNGGVPGYGTIDQLNFLRSRGPHVNPDFVILQFLSDNDFEENRRPASEWAHVEDGWLIAREGAVDAYEDPPMWRKTEFWLKNNLHTARFMSERIGYRLLKSGFFRDVQDAYWGENFTEDDEKLFEDAIRQIHEQARELEAEFLFLYTTGRSQVLSDSDRKLNSEIAMERVLNAAGVAWINVYRLMRDHFARDVLYYPHDGHWQAAGHRFVAEILCRKLEERRRSGRFSFPHTSPIRVQHPG